MACKRFLQDLQALPEDAFAKSFGPKTRTVADIVYEVCLINDQLWKAIRGEGKPEWPDGWVYAPEGFRTKEVVVSGFEASSNRIIETVAAMDDAAMDAPVETDSGPTTTADRCRFMTLHVWYHSGQLNYIQTLIGDDAWHWE